MTMYRPDFHPVYPWRTQRALYTAIHLLRTDKRRSVWYRKASEKITTYTYPHLYPWTLSARDFEV